MRGIILAGGKGTRLLPATKVMNKHLIPIGTRPMIEFPLATLRAMGIQDILLVAGGDHIGGFAEYLGDGSAFGVSLTYRVQQEAGGIAQALALGREFAAGQRVAAILGDNIFDEKELAGSLPAEENTACIFTKEIEDASRFGVVEFDSSRTPVRIVEKPKTPPSRSVVTGLYLYPADVFEVVKTLKPSKRGELEITDVNNAYLAKGRMRIVAITGFWSDAGTPESLFKANEWLQGKRA